MSNIEREIRQIIAEIYDDLPKNRMRTIVDKTLSKIASSKLVEETEHQRSIRIVSSIMDSFEEVEIDECDDEFINDKGRIFVEASSDDLSWNDIKYAFDGDHDFMKFSSLEEDEMHSDYILEGDEYNIDHGYGDNSRDEYDDEARSYSDRSLKPSKDKQEKFQIGKDRRIEKRPGNLLDDAVDIGRTKSDFSISR